MATKLKDAHVVSSVVESTQTTGTGTLDLDGAQTGFFAFVDELTDGQKVYYLIEDDPDSPTEFEGGYGTFNTGAPNTLTRDAVLFGSNGTSKISLAPGTTYIVRGILPADALGTAAGGDLGEVGLRRITEFASSGTYSKPSWLTFAIVEIVAGGGGGGGADRNSTVPAVGAGGSAGGFGKAKISASSMSSSETVTIGDGGAKGDSGATDSGGGNGGSSSFGSFINCGGGSGGGANDGNFALANAGNGGSVSYSGVDDALTNESSKIGQPGGGGVAKDGDVLFSGFGGSTIYGGGGRGLFNNSAQTGEDGVGAGSGGGGATTASSTNNRNGGSGASGLCYIYEYG